MKKAILQIALIALLSVGLSAFTGKAQEPEPETPGAAFTFTTAAQVDQSIPVYLVYTGGLTIEGGTPESPLFEDAPEGADFYLKLSAQTVTIKGNISGIGLAEASLTGITFEPSPAVQLLDLQDNQLKEVPLDNLPNLQQLSLATNQLTSVELSKLTKLESLDLSNNPITALSIEGNSKLGTLYATNTGISEFDLGTNTNLFDLNLSFTPLEKLTIPEGSDLFTLNVGSCALSAIDLSRCLHLNALDISENPIDDPDLSHNPELVFLTAVNCGLSKLNLSANPLLAYLNCTENQLTALDFSGNPGVASVSIYNNQIKGEQMKALVSSLPQEGTELPCFLYVINLEDEAEGNICTNRQVKIATDKGWEVKALTADNIIDYEGSHEVGVCAPVAPQPELCVYPTVAQSSVHVQGGTPGALFNLLAADGSVVLHGQIPASGTLALSVEHLPAGLYLFCTAQGTRRVRVE